MIKSIIIYIISTSLGIVTGALLSFVIDLADILNMNHAHDLGLGNFFLLIFIFGLTSQIGLFFYFKTIPVLRYTSGIVFLAFLVLLILL